MLHQARFENIALQSGTTLPYVVLVYKTFGKLNDAGDNCILVPTSTVSSHVSIARLVGRARALNPAKYFIVVVNVIGNGISTSPSNMEAPFHGPDFPDVTIADNVGLQHQLLTRLNVKTIALIYGFSTGAMHGFAWAVAYPQMVSRLLMVCGTASCWPSTNVALEGVMAAVRADPYFRNGYHATTSGAAMRAFARVFAGWVYSATFFRKKLYRELGYDSIDELLKSWDELYQDKDANNALALMTTWQRASMRPEELRKITARTILMPCDHDMFILPEDIGTEATLIPNAEVRTIHSYFGHHAGVPGLLSHATIEFEQALRDLLAR